MDAVEYFKIKGRMCAAHGDVCDDCPLAIDCFSKELENPEEAVKIVKEWNESHPRRTRQDEFLGKWIRNDNGTYSCSLCHSWLPEEQYRYARFCLYCGAEMRKE